ncbi:Trypsin-like serine proteases, typically periplasmic, contain C-terminal PDZ domain [Coprococcus sp. ART55/1]|jgi:serine protease Do|nr:Trypsin-like serine proteases, typically periplasmic, contain C-terminal PDZ domain [Coprococcus sp. ART55/1]
MIEMEQENKNQMNGNSGQAPQQDGLYHYSYMNNRGDSRFDRPSTNASQQTQNVQGAQSAQNNQTAGVHGSAQNAQTAGAQSSSQNAQTVGTQNASYSGFQRNVNGMEAWYDSQRMNQGYQNQAGNPMNNMGTGKPSDNNMRQKKAKDKKPKNRKSGFGKKAAGVVAAAVVFGLVAGVVFQGVRYGSDKLLGKDSQTTTEQSAEGSTENNAPQLKQASSDTTSTVYDVSTVAKKVMPSIVSITGTYVTTYDYWFNSYQQESTGAGSGIIIGKDDQYLYLATNYHVVQNAKSLSVTFVDDKSADAVVKGYVENNDIAVVTVKLSDISDDTLNEIKEIQVGSSDDLAVGDPCVAIGNALGYGQSVTVGYISALNREISASDETVKVLQTDAAINPGNSGGALVNMQGELIGINTAKYSDTSVEGMGYALPISDVQDIINDLIAGKNVSNDGTTSGQAYLGISAQTITSQYAQLLNMPEGVYISSVEQGSAAEECGLQSGDIICSLDGEDIADMETFHDKIVACNPGDKVSIVYYRNNNGNYEKQTATATLKEKQ